jgi:DNA polymerase I-like protein with 3'-5' exonuclease and polymerase domains
MTKVPKIAVVDKTPNRQNYSNVFFAGTIPVDVYHLCSDASIKKPTKKNMDIDLNPSEYDFVILVGSEALKEYTRVTSVTDYTGMIAPAKVELLNTKFIASISPAVLAFRPENKPVMDKTIQRIRHLVSVGETVATGDWKGITDYTEAKTYLSKVLEAAIAGKAPAVAMDSETTALYARKGFPLGLCFSDTPGIGRYVHADLFDQELIDIVQRIFDSQADIVFHNLKFDQHWFEYHFNIDFSSAYKEGRIHDTMLQHYTLDERAGTHGLKSLAIDHTDMGDYDYELEQYKKNYCTIHGTKKEDFTYDLFPWEIIEIYAAKDPDATLRLHNKFLPLIRKNPKLDNLYSNILIPGCRFLQKLEFRGVPFSTSRLKEASTVVTNYIKEAQENIYKFDSVNRFELDRGQAFNPASPVQLRTLLFDYENLSPTGILTDTKQDSTNAEALEKLAKDQDSKIAKAILEYRKYTKLLNTYIEKALDHIDLDGCLRTGFHLHTTTSGRLSSSGTLNLQQLPRDDALVKGCIKAREGYRIVAVDMTTAEVWVAAALSGDKGLQQVFINMTKDPAKYPDFHSNIAHMVFGLPCEPQEVKKLFPAMRQAAKAITFGILYGSGPAKVAQAVNEALLEQSLKTGEAFIPCTKEKAEEYIHIYFTRFPRLKTWIKECHNQILNHGFIYSHFGRKRRLRNITSSDRGVIGEELRSGFNAIIQGASSDILLLGGIDADEEIETKGLDARILCLVHDSVVAEVHESCVEEYLEIVVRNIQKDRGLSIPGAPMGVDSDSESGGSFDYSCGKLEKQYPSVAVL